MQNIQQACFSTNKNWTTALMDGEKKKAPKKMGHFYSEHQEGLWSMKSMCSSIHLFNFVQITCEGSSDWPLYDYLKKTLSVTTHNTISLYRKSLVCMCTYMCWHHCRTCSGYLSSQICICSSLGNAFEDLQVMLLCRLQWGGYML